MIPTCNKAYALLAILLATNVLVTLLSNLPYLKLAVLNKYEGQNASGISYDITQENGSNLQRSIPQMVQTSQQCASMFDFIYSGTNISVATSGRITPDNRTTAMSLVSAWLPSIKELWQDTIHPRLLPHVMNWAHSALGETAMNVTNKTLMAHDYQMVHNEFILPNLRKSLIHPMETMKMHKLIQIMERRLADPLNHPPLEIMVFGPSVVQGVGSQNHNWGLPGFTWEPRGTRTEFAWPARLEDVLNNVVFRGQRVVRVTNLASGGSFSISGTLTMEYRLFAENAPVPDIVIHSYAHTDSIYAGGDEAQLLIIQEFILAAHKLRCNVDGLPYVILYEDFLGYANWGIQNLHFVLKNLRTVSQAADWYDVMAASYATAFRHTVMSGEGFDRIGQKRLVYPNPSSHLPMIGWGLDVHLGMLYHSTTPWVLVFNILENMVNSCQDYSTMLDHKPSYDKLDVHQIPAVTPDILQNDLPSLWKTNMEAQKEFCKTAPPDGESPCAKLSWLVSSSDKMEKHEDIRSSLQAMSMDSLEHWTTEGNGGRYKVGWVASAPNATFTITVKEAEHDGIKFMTIVSMKSYGAKWEGSRLRVTVWDEGALGQGPQSQLGQYDIDGVHDLKVSTYFNHKFLLGANGIPRGNWLKARFDVIGGSTFKIQGILFCSR